MQRIAEECGGTMMPVAAACAHLPSNQGGGADGRRDQPHVAPAPSAGPRRNQRDDATAGLIHLAWHLFGFRKVAARAPPVLDVAGGRRDDDARHVGEAVEEQGHVPGCRRRDFVWGRRRSSLGRVPSQTITDHTPSQTITHHTPVTKQPRSLTTLCTCWPSAASGPSR